MKGQENPGKRARNGNQMDSDRLSNLPDPIIHHILSLMDTTYAVRTCVLSKKWKRQWTEIHSLNFNYAPSDRMKNLEQFIRHVLRRRRQLSLSRLNFINASRSKSLATRILNYSGSHNVEELETNSKEICSQLTKLPNLRILRVIGSIFDTVIPQSPHFASSLTTLSLTVVRFGFPYTYHDHFSSFLMLENLFLRDVDWFDDLKVSAPKLINLTISKSRFYSRTSKLVISAPTLKFFDFYGAYVPLSGMDECPVLETVKIQMYPITSYETEDMKQGRALDLLTMAERLSHVKSANISWNFSETCQGNFIRTLSRSC